MSFSRYKLTTTLIIILLSFGIVGCGQDKNMKDTSYKNEYNIVKLLEYKDSNIGDNTAITSIISNLPANTYNDGIELQTASKPYEVTVNYKGLEGIDLELSDTMKKNAMIIFSLIKNIDVVKFNIVENGTAITYEKDKLVNPYKVEYGENLENITKDKSSLKKFIENDIKE